VTTTRREELGQLITAEQDATRVLAEAARLVPDPDERKMYAHLRDEEAKIVVELQQEEARLDAEEFVAKAIDV
jgi:rubrerythrin